MPDISFFAAVQQVWTFFFGFFPAWFSAIFIVAIGLFIVDLGLKIAQLLKNLFWPF